MLWILQAVHFFKTIFSKNLIETAKTKVWDTEYSGRFSSNWHSAFKLNLILTASEFGIYHYYFWNIPLFGTYLNRAAIIYSGKNSDLDFKIWKFFSG